MEKLKIKELKNLMIKHNLETNKKMLKKNLFQSYLTIFGDSILFH